MKEKKHVESSTKIQVCIFFSVLQYILLNPIKLYFLKYMFLSFIHKTLETDAFSGSAPKRVFVLIL